MSESRPIVIHPGGEIAGSAMPGLEIRDLHDQEGRWSGWTGWIQNDAGDVSGWHHHAANTTYVYVIRGSITIDFAPGGAESIVAGAGDFFVVPPETVHRETTDAAGDLEGFIIRIGGEPEQVDVDAPEGAVE